MILIHSKVWILNSFLKCVFQGWDCNLNQFDRMAHGPFYRIGSNSEVEFVWNLYAILEKLWSYSYCTTSKGHIFSKGTVNYNIVFSHFSGIFWLSPNLSLPKRDLHFRI